MSGEVKKQENKPSKRKRKVITLEQKLEVLKMYEKKIRTCDIMRLTGLNEATLRCIRDNADSIKKSYADSTPSGAKRTSKRRPEIMQMMEKQLVSWINDEVEKNSRVTLLAIKSKALSLYEDLKKDYPEATKSVFTASSGWFHRFKLREQIQNLNFLGDYSTLDSFCSQLNSDCDDQDSFLFSNLNSEVNSFATSPQNSPPRNNAHEHIEVQPEVYETTDQINTVDNSPISTLTKDILLKNLGLIEDALDELQQYDNNVERSTSISETFKILLKPYYDLLQQKLNNEKRISKETESPNNLSSVSLEDGNELIKVQQIFSENDEAFDSDDSKEMILPT